MTQNGPNNSTADWLTEIRRAGEVVITISDTLLFLGGKRTTLEEKSIKAHYHRLAADYALLIGAAHKLLERGGTVAPPAGSLERLKDVNDRAKSALEHFLKVATYDANFLEQYFEFDYNTRLSEEYRFAEEVKGIAELLLSSL